MNRILKCGPISIVLALLFALPMTLAAQTRSRSASPSRPSLLASLPESDAVALVKMKRALNEAMPKLLATNQARLASANAQIDQFKERTGIDPRAFDEVAFGIRYTYPREGITKLQTIGLARGAFNPAAMVAAGRIAANGKYREEKYQGKTIYIFTLDQDIKVFGLISFRVGEFAASPVDSNTLAVGDPAAVRNVIDVNRGRKRVSAELIALASGDPDAIIGFGGNISPSLLQSLDIGNRAIAQDLSSVRQVYGSIGVGETNVDVFLTARTTSPDSARNLGDTLEGLKQLGALFVPRLSGAKSALAKSALNNLKITTQANELQIRTAVAQTAIAPLVGGL
jgi:hypothetical protein